MAGESERLEYASQRWRSEDEALSLPLLPLKLQIPKSQVQLKRLDQRTLCWVSYSMTTSLFFMNSINRSTFTLGKGICEPAGREAKSVSPRESGKAGHKSVPVGAYEEVRPHRESVS
uniref:Uncharacterized protein n=1 Tax=Cucumis melo TaxID=3656 RepID=A0A9I9D6Y3_CUCME